MSAEHDYGFRYDVLPPERENLQGCDRLAGERRSDRACTPACDLARELLGDRRPVRGDPYVRAVARAGGRARSPSRAGAPLLRGLVVPGRQVRAGSGGERGEPGAVPRGRTTTRGSPSFCIRIGINALMLGEPERARQLLEQSLNVFGGSVRLRGEAEAIGALGYRRASGAGLRAGRSSCSGRASRCARRSGSPGGVRTCSRTSPTASSSSAGSTSRSEPAGRRSSSRARSGTGSRWSSALLTSRETLRRSNGGPLGPDGSGARSRPRRNVRPWASGKSRRRSTRRRARRPRRRVRAQRMRKGACFPSRPRSTRPSGPTARRR